MPTIDTSNCDIVRAAALCGQTHSCFVVVDRGRGRSSSMSCGGSSIASAMLGR